MVQCNRVFVFESDMSLSLRIYLIKFLCNTFKEATMSHKHINRLKAKVTDSEEKLLDAEVRYQQRQAMFEAQTLIMESRECVIHALTVEQVSLVSQKASLEDWLKASERERDEKEEALEECKAEIKLLRERGVELMRSKDLLDKGERERKQREYNSKRSVLRSFKWEEETTDALVLRGAVAFGVRRMRSICPTKICEGRKRLGKKY